MNSLDTPTNSSATTSYKPDNATPKKLAQYAQENIKLGAKEREKLLTEIQELKLTPTQAHAILEVLAGRKNKLAVEI